MKKHFASLIFSALITAAVPGISTAQEAYPQKPILALIAYPAGGGTDVVARAILRTAEKYSGKGFVVDNRPGAGGAIGFTAMASALGVPTVMTRSRPRVTSVYNRLRCKST